MRGSEATGSGGAQRWYLSTLAMASFGSLAMWLALPPFDFWPLAWVAPMFWLALVRRPSLDGSRPYLKIYLAGFLFWLATIHWLTLPHPAASLGWIGLSWYLGFYVPLFVAISRLAVHRLKVPLFVAAPVVWTALEVVRAHFGGGFLMAALGHTQYHWITVIQISDLVGAYGVSFVIMLVAACLTEMLPIAGRSLSLRPLIPLTIALAAVLLYGYQRQSDSAESGSPAADEVVQVGPTIALVQGSIDTEFGGDIAARQRRIYEQYKGLTAQALRDAEHQKTKIDLVVWPESMYPLPVVFVDDIDHDEAVGATDSDESNPASVDPHQSEEDIALQNIHRAVTDIARTAFGYQRGSAGIGTNILFGADTASFDNGSKKPRYYSTSLLVDSSGSLVNKYNKMHPVMFGEYVPLGGFFPSLYRLTPLRGGLSAGDHPVAFTVGGVTVAPNICYETVIPHLIRRQVAELTEYGQEPAVLITQTNDGWFWGSAALDMHLICGVFRAVECRKPLLIAANTGISAWIDADGRLVEQCGKRKQQVIVARPKIDERRSLYVRGGDWFGWSCVLLTALVVPLGRREKKKAEMACEIEGETSG